MALGDQRYWYKGLPMGFDALGTQKYWFRGLPVPYVFEPSFPITPSLFSNTSIFYPIDGIVAIARIDASLFTNTSVLYGLEISKNHAGDLIVSASLMQSQSVFYPIIVTARHDHLIQRRMKIVRGRSM